MPYPVLLRRKCCLCLLQLILQGEEGLFKLPDFHISRCRGMGNRTGDAVEPLNLVDYRCNAGLRDVDVIILYGMQHWLGNNQFKV